MLTVKQTADQLGKHPNTIRKWTKVYHDFLSPSAQATGGKERRFADDDMDVLWTVVVLKTEGKTTEEIKADLATDLRIKPTVESKADDVAQNEAKSSDDVAQDGPTPQETATLALELVKGQVDSLTNERDYLRLELDKERTHRVKSETEAARLSGQLESVYRRHWYQFWKPDKPGE
jgi:DNA-binding transcriptional MerR regulator